MISQPKIIMKLTFIIKMYQEISKKYIHLLMDKLRSF